MLGRYAAAKTEMLQIIAKMDKYFNEHIKESKKWRKN